MLTTEEVRRIRLLECFQSFVRAGIAELLDPPGVVDPPEMGGDHVVGEAAAGGLPAPSLRHPGGGRFEAAAGLVAGPLGDQFVDGGRDTR